ncbi:hypothetical protein OG462_21445 [Streptomyces sp. NBC_01077]|uniref:hypothetical protein n=1 Tax=Streptomyces sp. NBC_01077 TaxID=2903746 RepID=UPI00386A9B6E|nr:hypothetical protein OG462_21445 [Streptomyces sp. NBC_01077]
MSYSSDRRPAGKDISAADVSAYAAVMSRDASSARLWAEGAVFVYDVPGRGQRVTPAEAARRFAFTAP